MQHPGIVSYLEKYITGHEALYELVMLTSTQMRMPVEMMFDTVAELTSVEVTSGSTKHIAFPNFVSIKRGMIDQNGHFPVLWLPYMDPRQTDALVLVNLFLISNM
jgi:hypothetical protein